MVFPIISLLYGAGKLAGAILMTTATSDPNDTAITMQFAGLAASILPFRRHTFRATELLKIRWVTLAQR